MNNFLNNRDIFSLGFGPFRWVCTSALESDLNLTDEIARKILTELCDDPNGFWLLKFGEKDVKLKVYEASKVQYANNVRWIKEARANNLVVGSQARILYSDQRGMRSIRQYLHF